MLEEKERERILKDYHEMILFRDIVERHKVKNIGLARFILAYLLQNFSGEVSVNRMINFAKLSRFGKNTVYNYVDKVQDSVAIFFINRFSRKVYERESWPKKVYLCDNGLAKVVRFSENLGKLMENCVFTELLKLSNRNPLLEIYYWKNRQGEVDFVLKDGSEIRQLIQVTYASARDEVEKREIKALARAGGELGCRNLLVVTWDFHDVLRVDDKDVPFIPLWQ